jgi:5,5'-dehydrodivanillate O-demethylase
MSEDFTLYRGASGQVYATAFRCAHRGTQLSTGWVEGETLRCRYHGWVYDGDGQCVEQPAEPEPFCAKVRIRSYPVYDYLGLIFIYMGEGAPPPVPHYPDFEVEGVRRVNIHPRRCNFFSNLENSCDEYHVCFTHRGAFGDYMETLPEKIWGEETDYGIARYGRRPGGATRVEHIQMPNMQQRGGAPQGPASGWRGTLAWRVPIDDENHLIPSVTVMQVDPQTVQERAAQRSTSSERPRDTLDVAADILAGKLTIEDILGMPNDGSIQDEVTQAGQGAIPDRAHERLGQSDVVILLLRQLWTRELRALAEGRPLKQWRRSAELDQISDEDGLA